MQRSKTPYVVQHVPTGRLVAAPALTARQALAVGIEKLRRELGPDWPDPTAADCLVRLHGWPVPVPGSE